jgi:hypothetical protein
MLLVNVAEICQLPWTQGLHWPRLACLDSGEMTDPSRSPSLHSNLEVRLGRSCALLSPAAPGIANYSTAAADQSFARS